MPPLAAVALFWTCAAGVAIALTLDVSVDGERVSANGNEISRVQSEIGYIASRVAPDTVGLELSIVEAIPNDPVVKLNLSGGNVSQSEGQALGQTLGKYVRLRLEGHSQQFATYLVLHGCEPWPSALRVVADRAPSLRDAVAFPWVRLEVGAPLAFPTQAETEKHTVLYVCDGDIAWAYVIPKKPKVELEEITTFRFDAIEFSPATSAVIRSVFDEMKGAGLVPTATRSPGARWWYEFQERLKLRSGIHWRTPAELNRDAQFD